MVSVALLVALVLIIFYFRLSRKGIIRKKLINAAAEIISQAGKVVRTLGIQHQN